MLDESFYDRIGKAETFGGSNRLTDGAYTFAVKNLIFDKLDGGPTFIAELCVLSSRPVALVAGLLNPGEVAGPSSPNMPGSTGSFISVIGGNGEKSAPGNIKAFLIGLDGNANMSPEDVKTALRQFGVTKASGKLSPARGMQIAGETYRKEIKSGDRKGQPFMGWNWKTVPGQTAATIEETKAKLDALDKGAA